MDAIELEFISLKQENTWQIADKPKYKKIIGCKRVPKTKYKQDGTIEKFKVRLVEKGNLLYKQDGTIKKFKVGLVEKGNLLSKTWNKF